MYLTFFKDGKSEFEISFGISQLKRSHNRVRDIDQQSERFKNENYEIFLTKLIDIL